MQNSPHFNKALEMAQKGGYGVFWNEEMSMYLEKENDRLFTQREIWSDPRFWKAGFGVSPVLIQRGDNHSSQEQWLWQWHSFIDHLAEEKDSEDFFEERSHA